MRFDHLGIVVRFWGIELFETGTHIVEEACVNRGFGRIVGLANPVHVRNQTFYNQDTNTPNVFFGGM